MLDADSIPIKSDAASAWKVNAPIIALIGTETPSRLKWLLDLQPASFLVKPLRSAGLYTALVVAFDTAQRRLEDAAHIERLEDRIRSRRVVFAAVLQIMRSHALSEAGRVHADPANRHATSHHDRAIMRRHHRRRRHAETEQPYRVTTAPVSRVP